jgi:four helix bundle protein
LEVRSWQETRVAARRFEDLEVWQLAHRWVVGTYRHTKRFPSEELFGLTSQLRRAAVSVPANIAEGFVKRGKADKIRFYNIAQGSLNESRYYLILSQELGYGETNDLMDQQERIGRMLNAYMTSIADDLNS